MWMDFNKRNKREVTLFIHERIKVNVRIKRATDNIRVGELE